MLLPDAAVKLQGDNYRTRQTLDILYAPDAYVLTSLLEIMSLTLQPTLTKISDEETSQMDSLIARSHVYSSSTVPTVYLRYRQKEVRQDNGFVVVVLTRLQHNCKSTNQFHFRQAKW